mgnify:CR=1 FL=1
MTWSMQGLMCDLGLMCWLSTRQQYGPLPHSYSSRSCQPTAGASVRRTDWQGQLGTQRMLARSARAAADRRRKQAAAGSQAGAQRICSMLRCAVGIGWGGSRGRSTTTNSSSAW